MNITVIRKREAARRSDEAMDIFTVYGGKSRKTNGENHLIASELTDRVLDRLGFQVPYVHELDRKDDTASGNMNQRVDAVHRKLIDWILSAGDGDIVQLHHDLGESGTPDVTLIAHTQPPTRQVLVIESKFDAVLKTFGDEDEEDAADEEEDSDDEEEDDDDEDEAPKKPLKKKPVNKKVR